MRKTLDIAQTILSFGLNKLIRRLGVNPRWQYAVWGLIAANELRGVGVAYEVGSRAIHMVLA